VMRVKDQKSKYRGRERSEKTTKSTYDEMMHKQLIHKHENRQPRITSSNSSSSSSSSSSSTYTNQHVIQPSHFL